MHGMCSVRFAKLINEAARFLGDKECYLEIGTYAGFTLLSAGYENQQVFIGVDNFSENYTFNGDIKKELMKNIDAYPGAYYIIDGDFKNVDLKNFLREEAKIGVFLIDGKHTYEEVMKSIEWGKPYLSDEAVVFFDDTNVPEVKKALDEIKQDAAFEEICFVKSYVNLSQGKKMMTDPYIHNGFSVMAYRRKSACQN